MKTKNVRITDKVALNGWLELPAGTAVLVPAWDRKGNDLPPRKVILTESRIVMMAKALVGMELIGWQEAPRWEGDPR